MKNCNPRKLAHAAALALALCLLSACEKAPQERAPALTKLSDFSNGGKKKDPKLDKNMDKSMEDVRNDALEQINKQLKNQEEANKKSLANKEKDDKRKAKEAKEKKEDPRTPKTFATGSAPITEIDPAKRNAGDRRSGDVLRCDDVGVRFVRAIGRRRRHARNRRSAGCRSPVGYDVHSVPQGLSQWDEPAFVRRVFHGR